MVARIPKPGDRDKFIFRNAHGTRRYLHLEKAVGRPAVANLAVALAADGKRVVCIDGDIGLRNLDVVMGLENRIVYDIVDVIEGRCRLRQAMIRDKHFQNLYLIPAAQTRDKTAVSPSEWHALGELRPDGFHPDRSPAG
jgi:septum site-determining protein MinD